MMTQYANSIKVDKAALAQFLLQALWFALSVSFH